MAGTKIIKQLLAERHISVNELADNYTVIAFHFKKCVLSVIY